MKAVGYKKAHPIEQIQFEDIDIPNPSPTDREILVEVKAISVNPVDTKIRKSQSAREGQLKVLGWDAVGIVRETGANASLFKPGDRVWYAGDISKPGTNAEFQLVDERIVGTAPTSLSDAAAAALPLTAITAWEMLFDRLQVLEHDSSKPAAIMVIGAAGGVGSIMVQLLRALTQLEVIATASRPESRAWLTKIGAHHIIDHGRPLSQELQEIGKPEVQYVVSLTHTDQHFDEIIECLAPQGKLGLIDDPELIDIRKMKRKSLSLHWELMFTRSLFNTDDIKKQHELLNRISDLVNEGVIQSTVNQHFGRICAENLAAAHRQIESNSTIGKIVLEGF